MNKLRVCPKGVCKRGESKFFYHVNASVSVSQFTAKSMSSHIWLKNPNHADIAPDLPKVFLYLFQKDCCEASPSWGKAATEIQDRID